MNKVRRKEIRGVYAAIQNAKKDLEGILIDEQEAFDNMPESFQDTDKGRESEDAIDILYDVIDDLDGAMENLDEIV